MKQQAQGFSVFICGSLITATIGSLRTGERKSGLRPALFISAGIHLLFLVLILFGPQFFRATPKLVSTQVDLVDLAPLPEQPLEKSQAAPPPPPPEAMPEPTAKPQPAQAPAQTQPQQTSPPTAGAGQTGEPNYVPQFKVDEVPVISEQQVLSRITYPPAAAAMGKEAVVILNLFIDEKGLVRKVTVLRDPGFGFGEAALAAVQGLQVTPARIAGQAVAINFRYPIRFKLPK